MTQKKNQRILIVDDYEMNREILVDMLENEFELLEAEDGFRALELLDEYGTEIDLVLLDIIMPGMDGFEVLAAMGRRELLEEIPVIMISVENTPAYTSRAYELGATDYINRPFDSNIVHHRVVNTMMLYAKQKKLLGIVADQIYEREKSSNLMIAILSHIVEFHNGESGLHAMHIHTITECLLKHLLKKTDTYSLSSNQVSLISMASALHDIGKVAIPDEILNKPGKLTVQEFEVMKQHSMIGAEMLDKLGAQMDEPLIRYAYEICRWHHERYDGNGYPDGLKGEEIPISAQVVALVDVYDALTSERVYKPPYSHDEALKMILKGECGVFNPLLIECFQECANQIRMEIEESDAVFPPANPKELRNAAEEMLRHKELRVQGDLLNTLELERTKARFFASMVEEIQFDYTVHPSVVSFTTWGA